VKVVFIFSLPRSGSTLLQRMLDTSSDVATTPETWLMLPTLGARVEGMVYAKYSAKHGKIAIDEFIEKYIGEERYQEAVRDFYLNIFSMAGKGCRYFVEKTPRNLFFAKEIIDIFEGHAKSIFLIRNPMAIASSMISTWGGGVWNIASYEQDFFECLDLIFNAYNPDCHLLIKYENLTADPKGTQVLLETYLDLGVSALNSNAIQKITGRMGDPTGQYKFNGIKNDGERWKLGINTYTKMIMYKRLLKRLGRERFARLGYDYIATYEGISRSGPYTIKAEIKDMLGVFAGLLNKVFQLRMMRLINKNKSRSILS
jgi:hypothetical protein